MSHLLKVIFLSFLSSPPMGPLYPDVPPSNLPPCSSLSFSQVKVFLNRQKLIYFLNYSLWLFLQPLHWSECWGVLGGIKLVCPQRTNCNMAKSLWEWCQWQSSPAKDMAQFNSALLGSSGMVRSSRTRATSGKVENFPEIIPGSDSWGITSTSSCCTPLCLAIAFRPPWTLRRRESTPLSLSECWENPGLNAPPRLFQFAWCFWLPEC